MPFFKISYLIMPAMSEAKVRRCVQRFASAMGDAMRSYAIQKRMFTKKSDLVTFGFFVLTPRRKKIDATGGIKS